MENIIYIGTIVSPFTGFYENAVFKMNNGVYWIQSKYTTGIIMHTDQRQ